MQKKQLLLFILSASLPTIAQQLINNDEEFIPIKITYGKPKVSKYVFLSKKSIFFTDSAAISSYLRHNLDSLYNKTSGTVAKRKSGIKNRRKIP